ncbi:hypothetical protein QA612_14255 [Evansella sp. AB-P1]|uniref:hypothetical protein n=1 Tax=Evansella sp. AB-P1 TaxID=3037653 RepID=UPI00241F06FE|nr:hypothetical protein [Evansella sp. AB-P1]MDG5788640.1 hypothetical protein [Evansella sp. AB-P1]
MNLKKIAITIVTNLFLGYLFIIFTNQLFQMTDAINNFGVGGLSLLALHCSMRL